MRVGILGAAEARLDGVAVDLGTRKQRALLAALALHRGRPVSPDTLVDLLWGEAPPTAVTATLQGYVAGLRRALEPDRPARAPSEVLVTRQAGYALLLEEDALDAAGFEAAVGPDARARRADHPPRPRWPSAGPLLDELDEALALWRGMPYAELEDAPAARAERARLEELRVIALEDRAVAGLALGRHATVAAELEALTATYPLRERLWGLRAVALARSGRQADALEVLRQVRDAAGRRARAGAGGGAPRAADRRAAPGPAPSTGQAAAGPAQRATPPAWRLAARRARRPAGRAGGRAGAVGRRSPRSRR